MAKRPVFYLNNEEKVCMKNVEFQWASGFSKTQKRKCIRNMHSQLDRPALEVSTKSESLIGQRLSAFNLKYKGHNLENIFQSSKVFEEGGPYVDLLNVSSKEAKRDERLKQSGRLIKFEFDRIEWEIVPKTSFYDYIYCNAVRESIENDKILEIINYKYFTDIEFNPNKSINTQARAIVLVQLLIKIFGEIPERISVPEEFLAFHKTFVDC